MLRRKALLFVIVATASVVAQQPATDVSKLTVDRIFSGEFSGEGAPTTTWLDGGSYATLQSSADSKGASDLVRVDASGASEILVSAAKLIPPGAAKPLAIEGYELSKDRDVALIYTNSAKVWRRNTRGDYWTYCRSTGRLVKLGGDARPSTLMFAKLSPDGSRVGYVRENDLFVEPSTGGPAVKLTHDGSKETINGTFDWVYEEEFDCRDGWRWSPDGARISYWQIDVRGVPQFTLVDNTSSKYPTLKTFAYPKTGEQNPAARIGVVATSGGSTTWMNIPGDTRTDFYLPRMEWADNPKEIVVQRLNRQQNELDVMIADAATGAAKTLFTERDSAWVDVQDDALERLGGGTSFSWISERDGWRSLYLCGRNGVAKRIVPESFDVIRIARLAEKSGKAYFIASPENPTQRYLYCTPLDGHGAATRVTPADQPGWHDYDVSPDGSLAIHTYSRFAMPPQVEIVSLPDHKTVRKLATNEKLRAMIDKFARTPVEFFKVDIGNGVVLDGWLMLPPNFDPTKKHPLLFHVYGEPAAQTALDRWGGTNYLWHAMLVQQGYAIACIDNRGTPCPRGREWRKCVYRKIGTLASADQAAAARELLKRPYLDPKRIGVWGWSGGGSMTLNLLFRSPDLYRVGISVAPVPDMRLYDTIYQERYMGLPQDHPEDYAQGSPITHAAGLKGDVLIVHGTGDDNCHYQGVERLANKLIELDKPFRLMPYPNRSHSVSEGKNTTRHLYRLMTRFLNERLPPGPRP